jgi:hypothetical protein
MSTHFILHPDFRGNPDHPLIASILRAVTLFCLGAFFLALFIFL